MSEYDATQIRDIEAPTLVLHAPDDTLVPVEQGQYTVRQVPGARFVRMSRGGHLALMLDVNAPALAEVRRFLDEYNPGSHSLLG